MKSYLEQLLSLRPSDQNIATIDSSIKALTEKRTAFAEKLSAIKQKRRDSMLMAPIAEIKSADQDIEELQGAVVQAGELISDLAVLLNSRRAEDTVLHLQLRQKAVTAEFLELEQKFKEFYAPLVGQFTNFFERYSALKSKFNRVNSEIQWHNRKAIDDGREVLQKCAESVLEIYFDRLALPEASLNMDNRFHTPMALKGEAWTISRAEPSPKYVFDQLRQKQKDDAQRQADFEASNFGNADTEYVSRNLLVSHYGNDR